MNQKPIEALLVGENREVACLLREVSKVYSATQTKLPETHSISELLMQAARCVAKQHMLQAELHSLALRDELTGLYNRRGFLALAEQQLRLCRRTEKGALLFFADLDGLKQINDSCGHLEGDLALIRTAEVLKETFRDSDIIARFGGDEFTILAIEASDPSEATIMSRLREALRGSNKKESRYHLSLSMGVARFAPRSTASIGELLAVADQDMYEQKKLQPRRWVHMPHSGAA